MVQHTLLGNSLRLPVSPKKIFEDTESFEKEAFSSTSEHAAILKTTDLYLCCQTDTVCSEIINNRMGGGEMQYANGKFFAFKINIKSY